MPARMQIDHLQSGCEPLTGRGPSGQPFPVERPEPPGEHREQRRGGPMPQVPEERRSRLPRGKPADHAAHQGVEVSAESGTGLREHPVRAEPRDGDEAEDLEELVQISAPALGGIGGLDPTHPTKDLLIAYPQDRATKRGRSLEDAETVHGDVCRRISHTLRPLEGLGAVLDEQQAALPCELRYTTEIHAPAEQVRDQADPRARCEGRLKHPGPQRERLGVDVYRYSP